jgi:hypothetical protein
MTCRQIWLSPLVDDGQSTDLTKSKKNAFDRQESVALKPVFLFAANFAPQSKRKKSAVLFIQRFPFWENDPKSPYF